MPTPLATAGRDTSGRAGTTWQSVIAAQTALDPSACQPSRGPACLLDFQPLPSMIDDRRHLASALRARSAPRSGRSPDCVRGAETALAGDAPVTAC